MHNHYDSMLLQMYKQAQSCNFVLRLLVVCLLSYEPTSVFSKGKLMWYLQEGIGARQVHATPCLISISSYLVFQTYMY